MSISVWRIFLLLCGMLTGLLITRYTALFRHVNNWQCDFSERTFSTRTVERGKPKILCYINTYPKNYDSKAMHMQATWARKCDQFYFTSTVKHDNLSVMVLDLKVSEVRNHLWVKMRAILRKLYQFADEYDYFLKADDDTYVVVDNLRAAVGQFDPSDPFMIGYRWNVLCPGGYFSGGAGYLLSREALKRIVEQAIDKHPHCPTTDEDKEDVKLCLCGQAVGVKLNDLFGETNTSLFYPYNPEKYFKLNQIKPEKIENSSPYLRRNNMGMSSRHISFHYVDQEMAYILEFLLYFMNPFSPANETIKSSSG